MTVAELIQLLQSKPQDLLVVYHCYSEQVLLETNDIMLSEGCIPRKDGWVEDKRPDKPVQKYLSFPGN